MIITVEAILATDPCPSYPPDRIRELVGDGLDPADPATLEVVLSLPPADARMVLSRLLTTADVVVWAQACADRAGMYAAASAAASTASYYARCASLCAAASAPASAAHFAAYTAAETSEDAGYAAEHKTACQHALALLAGDPQ